MSFDNTQLTIVNGFKVSNIVFGKAREGTIPNTPVTFKRLPIGVRNPDGTLGEFVLETPECYSFGLSENTKMDTGKPDGFTLSLCLYNRENPTDEQKKWVDTFNSIVEHIKEYLVNNRDEIGKYELEMGDLKKLNPLYYKKEKGKIVDGAGPVLYPKVIENKKTNSISTPFLDKSGNDIHPMTVLNKHCYAKAAIKFEGVFVGAKLSLQIKVYEAEVRLIDTGIKRLLRKPQVNEQVVMEAKPDDEKEDDGSVKGSDSESDSEDNEPAPAPVPVAAKAAPVRRTVQRKP